MGWSPRYARILPAYEVFMGFCRFCRCFLLILRSKPKVKGIAYVVVDTGGVAQK